MKNRCLSFFCALLAMLGLDAQPLRLSLDSCVSMALRENKQLQITKLHADIATHTRKAARTKYLPQVTGVGGYMRMGDEISLLSEDQQQTLGNLGTTLVGTLQSQGQQLLPQVMGAIQQVSPEMAAKLGTLVPALQPVAGAALGNVAQSLNQAGAGIADAFRTDTRDMFGASLMVNQPLYMGGAIVAGNRMAKIGEEIAQIKIRKSEEDIIYNVKTAYYLVMEVEHKKVLADEYAALIRKLCEDVEKMEQEGVATRADGLKVSVRLNEAEMQQLQAADGLALSKMLLCKLCGLPLDTDIEVEEDSKVFETFREFSASPTPSDLNRAELQMLGKATELYQQKVKSARAAAMPNLLLSGGYLASSPSLFNGFEKKFRGTWNVGVLLKVPVMDWLETSHKVHAAKAQTRIARMEQADARDMIDLQIQQSRFKLGEAEKKYTVTERNCETAEENLRCANLGFAEGVMTTTDVMMAQTAWLQAKTQKIEAEIGVITAKLALNHAYGN